MQSADQWFVEYAESHQNSTNKSLHWVCVPAILLSLMGLVQSIPVPAYMMSISPYLNWLSLLIVFALIYYFALSFSLGVGMSVVALVFWQIVGWMSSFPIPLWQTSIVIFVVAWIGQFIGHIIEGKKPSFFKDIQFLMIGPIWLLSFVYKRVGIGY